MAFHENRIIISTPLTASATIQNSYARNSRTTSNLFVKTLFNILEDEKYQNIIKWTEKGDRFVVIDAGLFTSDILPIHFNHSNFASFVRQLNKFGFHKIKKTQEERLMCIYGEQSWEFIHPNFKKNDRILMEKISKKISRTSSKQVPGSATNHKNISEVGVKSESTELFIGNSPLYGNVSNDNSKTLHHESQNYIEPSLGIHKSKTLDNNNDRKKNHNNRSNFSTLDKPFVKVSRENQMVTESNNSCNIKATSSTDITNIVTSTTDHIEDFLSIIQDNIKNRSSKRDDILQELQTIKGDLRRLFSKIVLYKQRTDQLLLSLLETYSSELQSANQTSVSRATTLDETILSTHTKNIKIQKVSKQPWARNVKVNTLDNANYTDDPETYLNNPVLENNSKDLVASGKFQLHRDETSNKTSVVLLGDNGNSTYMLPSVLNLDTISHLLDKGMKNQLNLSNNVNQFEFSNDYKANEYLENSKTDYIKEANVSLYDKGFHILIIDADPMFIERCKTVLEQYRITVDIMQDWPKTKEKILNKCYDLVIIDAHVKFLNVPILESMLSSIQYHPPIILMTSSLNDQQLIFYLQHGINSILEKPFHSHKLLKFLVNLLKDKISISYSKNNSEIRFKSSSTNKNKAYEPLPLSITHASELTFQKGNILYMQNGNYPKAMRNPILLSSKRNKSFNSMKLKTFQYKPSEFNKHGTEFIHKTLPCTPTTNSSTRRLHNTISQAKTISNQENAKNNNAMLPSPPQSQLRGIAVRDNSANQTIQLPSQPCFSSDKVVISKDVHSNDSS
ncbi:hypothetical protein TBLA_0E04980 [Henningerozyma blattae CBS 6284]|uniref:Heat shock transcription factor n=1 Tax=Henningerozyma blattae (strain ATCC 34711 / CBS 6284 / DSM 70876 / NBRC 10599 / NRRL Y-10934 / UCD 77-7) TaxID=1071380 RepID=I2H595_HENB6|nr:hypothetical protein TBLA_0E04980 [Tetrapisispora blattae CBS 6284]CCH61547.1 hypothetical protein TBLA_0E04980 [Tetrapisispora blattae CBS 6284]